MSKEIDAPGKIDDIQILAPDKRPIDLLDTMVNEMELLLDDMEACLEKIDKRKQEEPSHYWSKGNLISEDFLTELEALLIATSKPEKLLTERRAAGVDLTPKYSLNHDFHVRAEDRGRFAELIPQVAEYHAEVANLAKLEQQFKGGESIASGALELLVNHIAFLKDFLLGQRFTLVLREGTSFDVNDIINEDADKPNTRAMYLGSILEVIEDARMSIALTKRIMDLVGRILANAPTLD